MSLPRKEIPIELLDLYEQIRRNAQGPVDDTIFSKVSEYAATTAKFFARQKTKKSILDIVNGFKKQINELESSEDYIRLIDDLGKAAYDAQCNKVSLFQAMHLTEESSLLSCFLNAIRSFYVSSLSQPACDLHNEFIETRNRLMDEKDKLDQAMAVKTATKRVDLTDLETSYREKVIKLAYLEAPGALREVTKMNLLPELPRYQGNSYNPILVLQSNYYLSFYDEYLRATRLISVPFNDFCEKTIKKHQPSSQRSAFSEANATNEAPTGVPPGAGDSAEQPPRPPGL